MSDFPTRPTTEPGPARQGRPPAPPEERRSEILKVSLKLDERALLEEAASESGMPITVFIRSAAIVAARKLLEEAK
jgi:uncharacterized protein (DUF1778 family)